MPPYLNKPRPELDGIRKVTVKLLISGWRNSRWRKPFLTLVTLLALLSSSTLFFHNFQPASAVVQPVGRLYYGDQTNTAMRFQTNTFDFTFNGEASFTHGASSSLIAHSVSVPAPTRDEIMVGQLKVDGQLHVIKGVNGYDVNTDYALAWTNSGTTGAQTCNSATQADCTRAFDIAYEQLSGRAMVVYADTTNQKLYYCYWDGSAWGPQAACTPTNGTNDISLSSNGRPTRVSVKSREGTNELIMGVSIDVAGTHEVEAYRWTGSAWTNQTVATSTTNASASALESGSTFDVAWETLSGNAMVVWGSSAGSGATKYRYLVNGTWSGDLTGPTSVGSNGVMMQMVLASDPSSNRIAYTYTDDLSDSAPGVWKADGSTMGWTMGNEDASIEANDTGQLYSDVAWENSTSDLMWVSHNSATTVDTEFQTAACTTSGCSFASIDTTMPTRGGDDGTFSFLTPSTNSNDIMYIWGDIDRDLSGQHWDGSAWEAAAGGAYEADVSPGTADSTQFHGGGASFSYIPYSAWSRNWRFFDDETANDPSTGLNSAAENATPTGVDPEEYIRLRINVAELSGQGQTDSRKKLQFTKSCDPNTSETACVWSDVADTDNTTSEWRYASRTVDGAAVCADGSHCDDNQTFSTTRLTGSTAAGWYNTDKDAAGGSAMDQAALAITELDFPLKAQNIDSTTYYFRLYDVDQSKPVYREQDNDGANDCASATCTYPSLTTTAASLTQKATKLESDDGGALYGGTNTTTPYTIKIGERLNVRFQVENSGGGIYDQFQVEYDKNSDASWVKVLNGNEIRPALSVSGLDKEVVPVNRIGSCTGGYTFGGGVTYENRALSDAERTGPKKCQEVVFSLDTTNAVASVVYRLRLYDVTAASTITYTQYATFTANTAITDYFSKARQNVLPTGTTNLAYMLDKTGYTDTATDDSLTDSQNNLLGDANNDLAIHNPEATASDEFSNGASASAGDVNGDGYADMIVGCYSCDGSGTSDSGSAFIYYGSIVPDSTADVTINNPESDSNDAFGVSVSGAGDVNADGYADVIIGCSACDGSGTSGSGSAFVYYGGSSMDSTVDISIHNGEATNGDAYGASVSGAGDVNADGYADVIVGCYSCDGSGTTDSGSAFIYYGAATMDTTADYSIHNPEPTASDLFGLDVSRAGDTNADGYTDVLVGCQACDTGLGGAGTAYTYWGGASADTTADMSMLNPEATASDQFGARVSTAGDFNNDGMDDVMIGCPLCDGSAVTDSGSVYIFYGSTSGDATSDVSIHNGEATGSDNFGMPGSLGDINADGYDDVVIGCTQCDGSGTTNAGSAFVYYGGTDTTADFSIHNPEVADLGDLFGDIAKGTGDINGDGVNDLIIGCRTCDGSGTVGSGSAYVYEFAKTIDSTVDISTHNPESTANDIFANTVNNAGDVNGDGYDDYIQGCFACEGLGITDSGLATIYYGGVTPDTTADVSIFNPEGTSASFARNVSGAGDVNGDGYDDVIVGCPSCDSSGTTDAGTAFIYFGAASMDSIVDITLQNPEATTSDQFSMVVDGAGDVNLDGYDDVIISCETCDGSGTTDSGSAFIFYGGASMNTTVDVSSHNPEATGSDAFGRSVAGAGDTNADGYDDVIVGCSVCDGSGTSNSGSAFVYNGGSSMDTTADVSIHNPEPAPGGSPSDFFGRSVDTAGDVNGDGYADVFIGCYSCDGSGTDDSGSAFVYYGGSSMNSTVDVSIHDPEPNASDNFAHWVSSAGDANGDGYGDVFVGCYLCDGSGTTDAGSAFLYFGGIAMDATADVSIHNPEATLNDNFGQAVAMAGDVNRDGYSDVLVGCYACDGSGTSNSGSFFTYLGGKSADYNIFNFAKKNSDNSSTIDVTWKGQSTLAAATKNILLQVYRAGATNAWVTVTTESSLAADTAGTITGSISTNLSDYYDGSNISYWRVYQQADSATLGNVLQSQYFSFTFTSTNVAISGTVYLSDESTVAATVCDGVTAIVSVRVDGGSATTGTCHDTLATYSITISNPTAGQTVAVYLTSTEKANTIFLSDHAADTNIDLYVDHLALGHKNAGPIVITDLDAYDSDQNNTDMLFDAEDASPDTLIVESGNELHLRTSETFTPGGNVTTPKMHVKGTYTGASENLTINGSGTGTSRPLYIDSGTFTSSSNTTTFTGTSNSDIESTTYNVVQLYPASGTQTYTLRSGTFTANSNWDINNGAFLTVDVDTNDPNIVVKGNLTINPLTTYTKSATGTFTFSPAGTKTWTDNSSGGSDLGLVTIGSGTSTPKITMGAGTLTATSLTINSSHELDDGNNGRTLKLTGTGTPFTVNGTFRYGTSLVWYIGNGATNITALSGTGGTNGYYNLHVKPAGAVTHTLGTGSSQTIAVNHNFVVGDGSNAGIVTNVTNDVNLDIQDYMAILTSATYVASDSATPTLTLAGDYANSGTFTAGTAQVFTFDATSSGKTLSGTLNGTSKFWKVKFHNASGGGAWTIQSPMLVDTSSGTPAADTFVIGNGTVTVGDSASDDLLVYGGVDIAVTANETGTLQTMDGLAEGSTITIQINKDTSTQCANCIVDVGASSGSGAGTLTINENGILKLIPKSSATASDTGVAVASTGKLNVTGAISLAETASTAISDYDNRETTLCANADFSAGYTGKHVRMTSGLAFGQIYAITNTTVNDGTCDTGTHDSISRDNTSTSNVVSASKSVSGVIMSVCVPTIITANDQKIGSYLRDLTGTKGYFQIVDSANDDASCTGTDDLLKTIAYPDAFAGLTAGDTVDISDGVIPGDNFEIYDFAHVTAEDGVACTATVNQSGEAYISAVAGSETVFQYADVCNLGRAAATKYGYMATSVNGTNASEGVKVDKSRIYSGYYGIYFDGSSNNSTANSKGISNSQIRSNSANGLWLHFASTGNTVTGNNVSSNTSSGIALVNPASSSTVTSNVTNNNGSNGIYVSQSSINNTISSNTANGNNSGINIESSSNNNVVTSNATNGNNLYGIRNSSSNNTVFKSNSIIGNAVWGISMGGSNNILASSTVTGNTAYGIYLSFTSGSKLVGNQSGGQPYGLYIDYNSSGGDIVINDTYGATANTTADIGYNTDPDYNPIMVYAYNTTLSSSTETSGITGTNSFLISRKHDGAASTTKVWGEYSIPTDVSETPQDEDTDKFNYANNLWEKSVTAHGYSGTGTEDTDIAYDLAAGPADLSGGPYDYRLYTKTAGSGASCGGSQATMDVYRNGTDVGDLTTGTQFTDTTGSVNTKFTVACGATPYAVGDTYTFVAYDADNSTTSVKALSMMQDSDSFTVASGKTLQLKGQNSSTNKTTVTRGGSGGYSFIVGGTIDAVGYTFNYLGGTGQASGLDINSGATVTSLDGGEFDNFGVSNGTTDSFIDIDSGLIGSGTPDKTLASLSFVNTGGNADCNINATSTDSTGYWQFDPNSGAFAGESYDCDDGVLGDEGTPGQIAWTPSDPVFSQEDFRFANPSGVNVDYTGAPAENASYTTTATSDDFRLRMLVHVSTATLTTASAQNFKLQYGERTAANCTSGVSWGDVATGSGVIRYYNGASRADGDNLTTNAGDPVHGADTTVAQDYEESNNFTNSVADISAGQDGLWDFSLVNNSATAGKIYCFKIVESDGTDLTTYNQYPQVIIDEELTLSLDSTSKDFGVVTPGANPTDQTSTLTATTNAANGYTIYGWSTQAMTMTRAGSPFTLSDWTGTNASPTTFGNGSYGFGYSSNDTSITCDPGDSCDPGDRFSSKFAGFTHTGPGKPVADRTAPAVAAANTITYRLAGSSTQESGVYSTVVVYVIVANFP